MIDGRYVAGRVFTKVNEVEKSFKRSILSVYMVKIERNKNMLN